MRALSSKRLLIFMTVILAAVAVVLVVFDSRREKTPADFGEKFFGLVAKGDVDGSYALADEQFRQQTTKEQWQSTLASIGTNDYGKLTKISSGNNQVDPTLITSVYETTKGGQTYEVTIQTSTDEGGNWLVRYFWIKPKVEQTEGNTSGRDDS